MGDTVYTIDGGRIDIGDSEFESPIAEGEIIGVHNTDQYSLDDTVKFDPDNLYAYEEWMIQVVRDLREERRVLCSVEKEGLVIEVIKDDYVEKVREYIEMNNIQITEEYERIDNYPVFIIRENN